jgi:hypothetical protein
MERLHRFILHRGVQIAVHLLVIAALTGALFATHVADGYFNRGVASGADAHPIPYTDVNPLAVNTFLDQEADPANVQRTLEMIKAGGYGYIRQMFPWYEIEPERGSHYDNKNQVDAWAKFDRIVNIADSLNLEIIARLDKPPAWARVNQPNHETFPDGPPDNNADYANYVSAVVTRYKGKIHYIQIWNEPNLQGEWGGQPIDPAKFTTLLKAAYTAAKAADPSIVVLMPGLAPTDQTGPTNLSDLLFLQGMYDAGAKDYFDVASVMVYGYGYSPYDRRVEFARDNFSRPIQTREIMVKNGDADKPVWASEYGWVSLPRDWAGDPSPWGNPVSLEKQAKYLYQGYLRAQQEWPWMGVMAVWNFRTVQPPTDPNQAGNPTRGFSIVNYDFSPTPAFALLQQAAPKLDRAYTGAYTAASPRIEQNGNWALNGSGASVTLMPQQDGAQATINFSGTRLDLELSGGSSGLRVAIDGGNARTVKAGSGETTRVTIADGLSDGPHQALITATAAGAQSTTLAGFVVVRRTINSWIYPWIYATLALLLLLNLASLVWAILRNRVTSSSLPEIDHVFSAADLRKARDPTQHR